MAVGIYAENDDGVVVLDDSRNVVVVLAKNSSPAGTLFVAQGDGATYAAIEGQDLFDAMATRLQQRTVNDAGTLLSSNWETWRDLLQRWLET